MKSDRGEQFIAPVFTSQITACLLNLFIMIYVNTYMTDAQYN